MSFHFAKLRAIARDGMYQTYFASRVAAKTDPSHVVNELSAYGTRLFKMASGKENPDLSSEETLDELSFLMKERNVQLMLSLWSQSQIQKVPKQSPREEDNEAVSVAACLKFLSLEPSALRETTGGLTGGEGSRSDSGSKPKPNC